MKGAIHRIIALGVAATLSACAFRPQVTGMAVEYNAFVADATNRQTVLNILRARDREPLHFTSFTQVHGSATIEGSATLESGIGGTEVERVPNVTSTGAKRPFITDKRTLGATTWTPNVGIKVDTGTDFEIAINSTDDFWKGILTPIAPDTLVYLMRQGWPPDLLSYLFIERMDFSAIVTLPDKKTKIDYPEIGSISNDLSNVETARSIQAAVQCRALAFRPKTDPAKYILLPKLAELRGVAKDTLGTVKVPENSAPEVRGPGGKGWMESAPNDPTEPYVELASEGTSFSIALSGRLDDAQCLSNDLDVESWLVAALPTQFLAGGLVASAGTKSVASSLGGPGGGGATIGSAITDQKPQKDVLIGTGTSGAGFRSDGYCNAVVKPGYKCDLSVSMTLRSTEGVIYYLGEYIRKGSVQPTLYDKRTGGSVPIIEIATPDGFADMLENVRSGTAKPTDLPFVQVQFKRKHYIVYSSGETLSPLSGRSSEVITLVQQLLNMYRTAKDLPTTPYVRVLN